MKGFKFLIVQNHSKLNFLQSMHNKSAKNELATVY